jgi:L-alanine-DL-glutamate epimerase-like enolase superfamily enzyme
MHVRTDEGIEGVCTVMYGTLGPITDSMLEQLRTLVIGEDPLDREKLYQKLHTGTRWVYHQPGWAGAFDNCLWDIVGKAANLPVYAILGRVRDRIPLYLNIWGDTKEEAADDARKAVEAGYPAVKDHFYHPAAENIEWFKAVRGAVGPDVDIMHDAVGIYNFEQAVKVGRALEELDYLWFEEPMPERLHNKMKALCDALDIPVLAPEMMMNDVDLSAQWLISGATDLIRANARHGTTPVLKLAHLAELHGARVELNGVGGLFGLVHAHLLCSISNTTYYEYFGGEHEQAGKEIGMLNPVEAVDGTVSPPQGPGWGAEWDWDYFKKKRTAVM